jgi:hypothetical protein
MINMGNTRDGQLLLNLFVKRTMVQEVIFSILGVSDSGTICGSNWITGLFT